MIAAEYGHFAVVELLLAAKAQVDLADNVRVPPPPRIPLSPSRRLARERESAPPMLEGFRVARSSRRARGAEARVREREPPPPALSRPLSLLTMSRARASRVQYGVTPLSRAAQHGHLDVVCALLNAGADKTIADRNGYKPIDVVCRGGNKQHEDAIVALLR